MFDFFEYFLQSLKWPNIFCALGSQVRELCPPLFLGAHGGDGALPCRSIWIFSLHKSISWVEIKLDLEFQLSSLPGSAPSPPSPPRKLGGRSWLLEGVLDFFHSPESLVQMKLHAKFQPPTLPGSEIIQYYLDRLHRELQYGTFCF